MFPPANPAEPAGVPLQEPPAVAAEVPQPPGASSRGAELLQCLALQVAMQPTTRPPSPALYPAARPPQMTPPRLPQAVAESTTTRPEFLAEGAKD
jgi:hypothetical protein